MDENMGFVEVNGVKISVPCNKLLEALGKMQGMLDNAKKASDNPYFKSKYADLATCLQTAKKPMADEGLSLSQHCTFDGAQVHCVSVLGHSSGQMMVSTLIVPVTKKDAQGVGAAITYARRYALSAIIGLAQEDDDANAAVGANDKKPEPKKEQQKPIERPKEQPKEQPAQPYVKVEGDVVNILYPTYEDAVKFNYSQNYLPLAGFNANQCKYALSKKEYAQAHELIKKKLDELEPKKE